MSITHNALCSFIYFLSLFSPEKQPAVHLAAVKAVMACSPMMKAEKVFLTLNASRDVLTTLFQVTMSKAISSTRLDPRVAALGSFPGGRLT